MKLKTRILAIQNVALCVVRKWWRPMTCLGLMFSVWINLVLIPWWKNEPIQFDKGAAFVTAVVAAFAVREWGKAKGTDDK